MFKELIPGGRNLERTEVYEFGGLNTAAFSRDNEFSELFNLTNEEYPVLKTKNKSSHTIGAVKGYQLISKDAERGYEQGYVTCYRYTEEEGSVFKYGPHRKNSNLIEKPAKLNEKIKERQEQLIMAGGDYVLFPSMAYIKPQKKSEDDYSYQFGFAETEISSTAEDYSKLATPDSSTVCALSSKEFLVLWRNGLSGVKKAVDDGVLNVGDTLQFKYNASDEEDSAPAGFSDSNLYTILNITKGQGSTDKYDAFIKFELSATDENGQLVAHDEIEITNIDTNKHLKSLSVTKKNPFILGTCFGGRLFCCDVSGNSVWTSKYGDFLNFRVDATDSGGAIISCGEPSRWTAIKNYNESIYCFKLDAIYRIDGSGALSYEFTKISDLGAINQSATAVISDSLFFFHKTGIYRFSGGAMQHISLPIEKELEGTTSAVLGGSGHVLYVAANYEGGLQRLFVYNIEMGMWHEESTPGPATIYEICDYAGKIVCACSNGVHILNPDEEQEQTEGFRLVTKEYFYLFDKKAVGEVNVRMSASSPVKISVSYDKGEFTTPREVKLGNGIGRVPIKLRKCTTFKIKIEGSGKATIYGMEFSLYRGGRWYGK